MEKSKYWQTMMNILERQFPKGECQERANAISMVANIDMMLQGTEISNDGIPERVRSYGGIKKDDTKKEHQESVRTQNKYGEFVPAIPLPYYGFKKQCSCGKSFWTEKHYREHFALEHILGLK